MADETWRDILAYDPPRGFRPPHWCAVLAEVTIFLLFGIGAALLRFTDWASLFRRSDFITLCADPSFHQVVYSNDYSSFFYIFCIIAPLLMVIFCEIERSYYSVHPNYKMFTATQRFFYISLRPLGMFILGIFIISVITDYIKFQVAWPRPYFFNLFPEFCLHIPINETLTLNERYGLTSFPCHLSALSSFTTCLTACYIHHSVSLHSVPMVKPMMTTFLFLVTVSGSIYRVNINYNHWLDVIFGMGIGSFFSYLLHLVLLQSYFAHQQVTAETAWRLLLPRVNLPPLHVQPNNYDNATIRSIRSHQSRSKQRSNSHMRSTNKQPYWLSD